MQVAVGGELGPDGGFLLWDEATWEVKRKQLAAAKPPYPDFPFPGWVAAQPHHWLIARTMDIGEKDIKACERLRDEWKRRTGRDIKPEPDTWRTTEVAPTPRVVK